MATKKSNDLQTIYVMWLREMKRFLRARSRVIGTLIMPFFFLLSFGFGLNPMASNFPGLPEGADYIDFLVPGIVGMTILFNSMGAGISVLWDREFGFLKEIMVAPVKRTTIVLGRVAGGITTAIIQAILVLLVSFLMGFHLLHPWGIFLALLCMFLIGTGFIGFGVAIASKMEDTQGFSTIMQFIIFPVFLLSGAFFPVANLPKWLQPLVFLNPLTYGIDGLRGSLIGFSQFSLTTDLIVLFAFSVVMVILGAWFFNRTEA